jgi:geranylgeranylglycerol-phosphate geranylgeranyltransferase
MKKILAYLRLARFHNLVLVFGAVILGGWLETEEIFSLDLFLAAFSALLVAASGYVYKDYRDFGPDQANKAHRPLPKGEVGRTEALALSLILAGIGFLLVVFVNLAATLVCLLVLSLLFTYNRRWKRSFLLGNIAIGLLAAGPFIYGGLALGKVGLSLVPATFSFVFHLGREILKDLEDQQADRQLRAQTLPLKLGSRKALVVITLTFVILMILVFVPYLLGLFNQKYLVLAVLGVDFLLLYVLWSMWKDESVKNLARLNSLLKLNMFLGLLAIVLGRL